MTLDSNLTTANAHLEKAVQSATDALINTLQLIENPTEREHVAQEIASAILSKTGSGRISIALAADAAHGLDHSMFEDLEELELDLARESTFIVDPSSVKQYEPEQRRSILGGAEREEADIILGTTLAGADDAPHGVQQSEFEDLEELELDLAVESARIMNPEILHQEPSATVPGVEETKSSGVEDLEKEKPETFAGNFPGNIQAAHLMMKPDRKASLLGESGIDLDNIRISLDGNKKPFVQEK